jgi:molecular chaperone GrpE (heat shock protein)
MGAHADEAAEVSLADVMSRLGDLSDLFRRRLLEDADKRHLIEDLHDRVRRGESGMALEYLLPLVYRLLLIVDRLDDYKGADPMFAGSVRSELLLALHQHGVESIDGDSDSGGTVDPAFHEVVTVVGEPPGDLRVGEVVQRGFRYGPRLLRPARVVAEYQVTEHRERRAP